ncbi:AI-2E family transporter [Flavihumibacter solisilvae]|uniref:AI-2E family transporter n=1 Tax=Flavihumibacter solisilvae TaxID=1349421 RepID=UPI00068F1DC7|nr:AI-2E family transporter [Flavihumibacter solisilvae]
MNYLEPNKLRQVFFLVILIFLGILLFVELQGFLPATLGAFTLYILMSKQMRLLVLKGWRPSLAAAVLMLLSFVIIVLPIGAVVKMLVSRLSISEVEFNQVIRAVEVFINDIERRTGMELLSDKYIGELGSIVARELPLILSATFNTITTVVIMYFILYFMLVQGKSMESATLELLPMSRVYRNQLQKEVRTLVISNAVGIPLIAVLQGVVALVGYLLLGVDEPVFWFAITCVTAMLPIVGAALAYVPLAIMFFVGGETWRGVAMLLFGFGIIGTVDNIFRFWLQKKIGDVHPLITVFGVILGLKLFGFVGLIFGPLLISVFILLIRIYKLEFSIRAVDTPGSSPAEPPLVN